jgi:N utilization substance protein B
VKRSELREHIFRMVFSYEFNSDSEMPGQMQLYFEQLEGGMPKEEDVEYIRTKALNVILKADEADVLINKYTKGWKTSRMNKVDLSILRLAVYEMKWDADVPEGVAINEAVELAKKYSGEDGPSFVNGVLAKLIDE